jgi:hypothetical protein
MRVNSTSLPTTRHTDALTAAFIRAREREFAILNKGSRGYQYGHIGISDAEKKIIDEKQNLQRKLATRPVGRQYPCVCGRGGKKMKNCCGKRR